MFFSSLATKLASIWYIDIILTNMSIIFYSKKIVNQRGVIHLALPLLLLLLIGAAIYILFYLGFVKNPFSKLSLLDKGQKVPEISTKTIYQNPFKKETQYVNPFKTYKNPFLVSR